MKTGSHNNAERGVLQRILGFLPPPKMKTSYKRVFYLLFAFAIILSILSYFSLLGSDSQAARLIQILSGLAVAVTAVIALSNADHRKAVVEVNIERSFSTRTEHYKKDMSDELKDAYKDYPDPLNSYRVQFKMTNTSGFTLVKPNVAFRVPLDRKHPHRDADGQPWSRRTFNSNLYNSIEELRMLEFADTCVISNSNLPYWNDRESISLWIRMLPYAKDGKVVSYDVVVSVYCEDADGVTEEVEINPDELMKDSKDGRSV